MKCKNCKNQNDSELKCSKNQTFGITKPEFFHCDYFDIKHENHNDWWENLMLLDKFYYAKKYKKKTDENVNLFDEQIKEIFDNEFYFNL